MHQEDATGQGSKARVQAEDPASARTSEANSSQPKPRNGLSGLVHWRHDLFAGLQVALVSLPLSLGIAIASGAPPVAGLVSSIIAGLVFPFLGGAYVTISGPAAGLAPALFAGMLTLGAGDVAVGYPLLLVAIFFTGLTMIALSILRAGKYVALLLPVTVVEGMLAAIGVMIIVKQFPALVGDTVPQAKAMLTALAQLPGHFTRIDSPVFAIGAVCLALMFYLNRTSRAALRKLPPALVVCAVGIALGFGFDLPASLRITMPENLFEGGITLPAFDAIFSRPELWGAVAVIVITLTLIDSVESLATVSAVDKIDPWRRKSRPNVTLRAMGVSNLLSSLAGGLTIIPGGVKSRANIDAGGRTLWANFYNAMFLLLFLFAASRLITRIPLATIAAVIVYVGWRLCEPVVVRRIAAIGLDQLAVFVVTVAAVLATDLLLGILIGVAFQLLLNAYLLSPPLRWLVAGRQSPQVFVKAVASAVVGLARNPVIKVETAEPESAKSNFAESAFSGSGFSESDHPVTRLSLTSLTSLNLLPFDRTLTRLPPSSGVHLTLGESSHLVDRTAMEYLEALEEDCAERGRKFELSGLDRFQRFATHPHASRMRDARAAQGQASRTERAEALAKLAQNLGLGFAPAVVAARAQGDFVYLKRGSDREAWNLLHGSHRGFDVRVFDYSHTAAPEYYVEHRHTLIVVHAQLSVPDFAVAPGDYLERYLVAAYRELSPAPALAGRRTYASDPERAATLLAAVADRLAAQPDAYLEARAGALLVFRPGSGREAPDAIPALLALATDLARELGRV